MFRTILIFLLLTLATAGQAWGQTDHQESGSVNQTVDGKRQGHWIVKDKTGKTEEGDYADGKKVGVWTTRSGDGTIRAEITYTDGLAKGPAKIYFPDGTLMESGTWNVNHWEKSYTRFNESGSKACDFTYNDKGHREGRQVYYHENGKVMYDGEWSDGKITGSVKMYDESGKKTGERQYDASGKFCGGTSTINAADTGRQTQVEHKELDKTGTLTVFDDKGRKLQQGKFINGKLMDGEKYTYNEKGKLIRIDKVKNGKVVSHVDK